MNTRRIFDHWFGFSAGRVYTYTGRIFEFLAHTKKNLTKTIPKTKSRVLKTRPVIAKPDQRVATYLIPNLLKLCDESAVLQCI